MKLNIIIVFLIFLFGCGAKFERAKPDSGLFDSREKQEKKIDSKIKRDRTIDIKIEKPISEPIKDGPKEPAPDITKEPDSGIKKTCQTQQKDVLTLSFVEKTNLPLAQVKVILDTSSGRCESLSDENGKVRFEKLDLKNEPATITAIKPGYEVITLVGINKSPSSSLILLSNPWPKAPYKIAGKITGAQEGSSLFVKVEYGEELKKIGMTRYTSCIFPNDYDQLRISVLEKNSEGKLQGYKVQKVPIKKNITQDIDLEETSQEPQTIQGIISLPPMIKESDLPKEIETIAILKDSASVIAQGPGIALGLTTEIEFLAEENKLKFTLEHFLNSSPYHLRVSLPLSYTRTTYYYKGSLEEIEVELLEPISFEPFSNSSLSTTFKWNEIKGADIYELKVFLPYPSCSQEQVFWRVLIPQDILNFTFPRLPSDIDKDRLFYGYYNTSSTKIKISAYDYNEDPNWNFSPSFQNEHLIRVTESSPLFISLKW